MTNPIRHHINLVESALTGEPRPETVLDSVIAMKPWLILSSRNNEVEMHRVLHKEGSQFLKPENSTAENYFDFCISRYEKFIQDGQITLYREMYVDDFRSYIHGLRSGNGTVGQHWSTSKNITTPWDGDYENHNKPDGVRVFFVGKIKTRQVDWEETLKHNFEFPEEHEVWFDGNIYLQRVVNLDGDTPHVIFNKWVKR